MMKILIIDDCVDLVGGVERTISTLANELVKENDVEILSENNLRKQSFYKFDSKIKKKYLYNQIYDKSLKYKKNSIKYILYKIKEKVGRKVKKNMLIKKFINDHTDVDVIIFGRVFIALDFLPYIAKCKIQSKIIVRDAIHLYYFNDMQKKKILKYFPSMIDTFIVSSEESINEYRNFFGSNCQINLVKLYNPIGINPIRKYNYNSKTVISIGRMDDDQKGFENLIRAFIMVNKQHPDWNLKLYGDGVYKKKYENLINSFCAQDYIEICPATKDVVKEFNDSAMFVLASRYEGYANILVEALSCGIPSISYDWYLGIDEIIKDNKNGLVARLKNREKYFNGIVDNNDIVELASKIIYLIENKNKCDELSNNSVDIIETRNVNTIVNDWKLIIRGENE